MTSCRSSTSVSCLVNGSPSEELCPPKGLRQGDPISPFLFIIAAEGLNMLLSRAREIGLIKGVMIGDEGVKLSHLQFADDTVLFCERKIHLVKWKEATVSKNIGGLGIKEIKIVNESLLAKWWWRFGVKDDALWKILICRRYGVESGRWFPFHMVDCNSSWIWSDILLVAQSNTRLFNFFMENVEIRVGSGSRIKFWEDVWLGKFCLKNKYPRLFSISNDKGVSLKDKVV
ncbi:uncharacterized protein LOC114305626 [Camellia sinensis]|uniref:uncharacterized protein LOC114305626 n=1 Tax=Camellia sinensis TaxID=4442 RepID=UPI0010366287|nr:uncharacterized protein LOC114305626 [Camellia sinensis]